MKVIDTIQKIEKDLSYDELVDLMANHNRQVDLILTGKKSDEDSALSGRQGTAAFGIGEIYHCSSRHQAKDRIHILVSD